MSNDDAADGPDGPGRDDATSEVARLRQMRTRLAAIPNSLALLEGIFTFAPVGFQIYDGTGRSILTNQAFRDLFGSEPPPEYNVLKDEIAAEQGMLHLIQKAFAGEIVNTPPLWYDPRALKQVRVTKGRSVAVKTTFFPLRDATGGVSHVAIVFKDVTAELTAQLKAEELAQQSANDVAAMKEVEARLQEAIRVREDFVSIAGHEMKTPLTALQLTIESLGRLCHAPPDSAAAAPTVDPQIVVKVDSLQRQARRLIRLVDQLLDVSRITAGRFKLQLETFDLVALTSAIIARATEEHGPGQSTIDLFSAGPVVGTWDRLRLDQVITNLISNAVKYGERTAVRVTVRRTAAGAQVAVRDDGIGIEAAQQARIFDRFERAVSDRNFGGLGLGLWIVRQIVDAMNGRVYVESELGSGATFIVELPAADPPTAHP